MRALLFLLHAVVTMLKMAGDAIVSTLWRLNVYGEIIARLLFDATELWCSTTQSYQELCTKALSILVPIAIAYLCESGFPLYVVWKTCIGTYLNSSNHLHVAIISKSVPRYERIFSRKQQQKVTSFVSNE